jgi:triosephosphate isomerase
LDFNWAFRKKGWIQCSGFPFFLSFNKFHQGESNELVGQKTKSALDGGMNVIVCIGETVCEILTNLSDMS